MKPIDLNRKPTEKRIPLSEYPRMQFRRDSYFCLNGTWELEIDTKEEIPLAFTKSIVVPFPVESLLSGVHRDVKADEILYYRKSFRLEKDFCKDIVVLHLDGVDQFCEVYLNRVRIAAHEGGYLPFEVEIQDYLQEENELIVKAKDPLDKRYPYGKQSEKSHGMWYENLGNLEKRLDRIVSESAFFGDENRRLPEIGLSCAVNRHRRKANPHSDAGGRHRKRIQRKPNRDFPFFSAIVESGRPVSLRV